MIIGDRIRDRLSEIGESQASLAREIGVTPQAISKMVMGGTTDTAKLWQIARFLRTSPEYLTGETDTPDGVSGIADRQMPFRGMAPEKDPDIVELAQIDLRYGMGATYLDAPVTEDLQPFSRTWLKSISPDPPESLFWALGDGDSMEPTIRSGEMMLINRSERSPRSSDGIWALAWGEIGMVKRLRLRPDGEVEMLSDNPLVPPINAAGDEIHLIGRVVAVVRRL